MKSIEAAWCREMGRKGVFEGELRDKEVSWDIAAVVPMRIDKGLNLRSWSEDEQRNTGKSNHELTF